VLWVITVAAFLGTVIAGVFAFFLFSQRDRIRNALTAPPQRRTESRTPARVEVQLLGTDAPFINEITRTENVSQYGARVITKTKWRPNDAVTLKLLRGGLSNEGRIAYCKPLKAGGAFAIGLQFSSPVVSWMA
jgi:PilZ domain